MRIQKTTACCRRTPRLLFLIAFLWLCLFVSGATEVGKPASAQEQTAGKTQSGGSRLPTVRLEGNYFSRDGHRFIPVGANWVPAKGGNAMAHAMGPESD